MYITCRSNEYSLHIMCTSNAMDIYISLLVMNSPAYIIM